jgi:hypothetical protein
MTPMQRLLARHGLTRTGHSAEVAAAFEVFKRRTAGLCAVAWELKASSPDGVGAAFEQFGFDCYTQGALDAVEACRRRPEFLQELARGDI